MRKFVFAALFMSIALVTNAAPPRLPTIQGNLYGGQAPIIGAQVYLYEPGTPSTTGTSSKSILKSVLGSTQEDPNGNYYVTTMAPSGTFNVTGLYTCDVGQPVYVYAYGGDSTTTTFNTAIGQMGFLGICPSGGTFSSSIFLYIDEVTTVAVAYSVAGYATDTTHISYDGSASGLLGITNAFSNVNSLVNGTTGLALTANPSGSATVPQATIDTIADILGACVNTASPSSPECSTLLRTATSTGTSTGVQPPDTGTAAINIAHHPASNTTTLFNLPPPNVPFQPTLDVTPNDFTIGLTYSATASNGIGDPWAIAIDSLGDAWIASVAAGSTQGGTVSGGSIAKISPAGAFLSPTNGYASSFFSQELQTPTGIAIDSSNNAWVTTYSSVSQLSSNGTLNTTQFLSPSTTCSDTSSPYYPNPFEGASGIAFDRDGNAWITGPPVLIFKLSSTGQNLSDCGYTYSGLQYPIGIAIDNVDNVWIGDYYADLMVEMNQDGTTAHIYSDPSFQSPNAVAIDSQNNVWVANIASNGVSKISGSLGQVVSVEPNGFTGGGLYEDAGVGIDGAGDAWFTPDANNNVGVVELSSAGAAVSGAHGYETGSTTTSANAHYWTAIDNAGNVWVANTYQDSVTELIGAATPVVTPLAVGVVNQTLGTMP